MKKYKNLISMSNESVVMSASNEEKYDGNDINQRNGVSSNVFSWRRSSIR